jgi:hypothetical protein
MRILKRPLVRGFFVRRSLHLLAASAAIVFLGLSVPLQSAQAQGMGGMGGAGGHGRQKQSASKTDDKTTKADDKAYKDALKRIPEPKEKYDPWSGARPATADQKTDQKTK